MAIVGAVSPPVVGMLFDWSHGNWMVAFGASMFVLLLGPLFAMQIRLDEGSPEEDSVKHHLSTAPAPSR